MLAQLKQKETEIQQIVDGIQQELQDTQSQLSLCKSRYSSLQQDFLYNLSLLQERDTELTRLECIVLDMKQAASDQELYSSDLRVLLDEKNADISSLKCTLSSIEMQHQDMIKQLQRENQMQWLKTQNILSEKTNDYLYQIQELKNQLGSMESDKKCLEMTHADELKCIEKRHQMESEATRSNFESKIHTLSNQIQEYELQSKLVQDALDKERVSSRHLQDELKTLKWENTDLTKMLNTDQCDFQSQKMEWKDLERKYQCEINDLHEEFEQKLYKTNTENARELERQSVALQECTKRNQTLSMELSTQIPHYQQRIVSLESQLTQCLYKISQFESSTQQQLATTQDLMRQNENLSTKLKTDRYNLSQRIKLQSAELDQRDGLLQQLNHEISRLLTDKDANAQLLLKREVEWEKRLKETNVSKDTLYHDMLTQFKRERDQNQDNVDKLEVELEAIKSKSIPLEDFEKYQLQVEENQEESEAKIQALKSKNTELGHIIHQMRVDMEAIQNDLLLSNVEPTQENPLGIQENPSGTCIPQENESLQENQNLKSKLDIAIMRIKKLLYEKSQLVDMSNVVRAQFKVLKETKSRLIHVSTQTIVDKKDSSIDPCTNNNKHTQDGIKKSQNIKNSLRQTKSQIQARKTLHGGRRRSTSPNKLREEIMQQLVKGETVDSRISAQLKSHGIRNWNQRDDEN